MKRYRIPLLLLCALALAWTLLPGVGTTARAAERYGVTVGSVAVTSDNAADVLGDGAVSYDAATNTLLLDGYDNTAAPYGATSHFIEARGALNVVLRDSRLAVCENAITQTTTGKLDVTVENSTVTSTGWNFIDAANRGRGDVALTLRGNNAFTLAYALVYAGTDCSVNISVEGSTWAACAQDSVFKADHVWLTGSGTLEVLSAAKPAADTLNGVLAYGRYSSSFSAGDSRHLSYTNSQLSALTDPALLQLCGVPVLQLNSGDILGDGTASYDRASNTLRIDELRMDEACPLDFLAVEGDCTVVLSRCTLRSDDDLIEITGSLRLIADRCEFYAGDDFIRAGDRNVSVTLLGENRAEAAAHGITTDGPVALTGGQLTLTAGNTGLQTGAALQISRTDLTIDAGWSAVSCDADLTVTGSTLRLTAREYNALESAGAIQLERCSAQLSAPEQAIEAAELNLLGTAITAPQGGEVYTAQVTEYEGGYRMAQLYNEAGVLETTLYYSGDAQIGEADFPAADTLIPQDRYSTATILANGAPAARAALQADYFLVNASAAPEGSISPSGELRVGPQGQRFTITPNPGYAIADVLVNDVPVGDMSAYTLIPTSDSWTIAATFSISAVWENPFSDVEAGKWYYDGIEYVCAAGLMNGVGSGRFDPNGTTTRAMLVTILYRLEGEPAVSGSMPFTDVPGGKWYSRAIQWAYETGVVNGVSATGFAPNDPVTRQQLAAILYRYARAKGYDTSASAALSGFPDADSVSSYARTPMQWAVGAGIINGVKSGDQSLLAPNGNATRAQVATMLTRFCKSFT